MSLIPLPGSLKPFLQPYLPTENEKQLFVTLTWAQSLDSRIASEPGVQTKISHLETKTMTHYLRAHHDAILVGVGTVLADDPKLNCRYGDSRNIRPVIVDPNGKWDYSASTLCKLRTKDQGLAPYIFVNRDANIPSDKNSFLLSQGGRYFPILSREERVANWPSVFDTLYHAGVKSVMVEGGAVVINSLLTSSLVNSVIITIGPVFLGETGVCVSPPKGRELVDVDWWKGQTDSVIAGRFRH